MARQNINLGADPNDGEGDNLRTAFDKVNDNFIEVYTAGPVGSNIVISGNVISSNVTNANIELSPNGIGKVVVKNDLRPDQNNLRYLGDANLRFRGAYIGTAGINSTGDIITTGNISANNIQYTGEVFVGDLKGSVFADDSTVIVDAIDNVVSADSGIFSNITAGNILPSANVTYNLGSPTRQWNELYLSGNTIYINGSTLSVSGNTLQIDGEPILSNAGTTNINTTGNITATRFVGDGSALTGIAAGTGNLSITDTTISAPDDTNITIQALDIDSAVRSGINLTPDGGAVSMSGYSQDDNRTFDANDWSTANWITSGSLGTVVLVGAATVYNFLDVDINNAINIRFSINGSEPESLSGYGYSPGTQTLTISTASAPVTDPTTVTEIEFFYSFSSRIGIDYNDETVSITARGQMNIELNSDFDISLNAADDIRIEGADSFRLINTSTTDPIRIITDDNNNGYTWAFNANGTLTFPDSTVQSTAWTGSVAYANVSGTPTIPTHTSNLTNDSGFITGYTVTSSDVTAHQANLSITESQISDLSHTSTGNFSFTNNNITTSNAASNISIAINGATAGDPPAFVSKQWSFNTDGSFSFHNPLDIPSLQATITAAKVGQWDDAYGWGDHSTQGYLTSYTVTSDDVTQHQGNITAVGTLGSLTVTGNISGGNLISNNSLYANVDLIVGDRANASASKGRFVSNSGFMYLQVGNGTPNSTGNIVFSPYQSSTARVTVDTASGNISATGNISGGNLITSGRVLASGNILGLNFATEGSVQASSVEATGNISGANLSVTGNISGNTAGYAIGYRDIPQVSFTGNATIATTDAGKHFYSTQSTDYILTIANNASQGFQVGAAITVVNQGTGNITIAQGSGVTLYLAGNATSGNRTVSTFGMATIIKVTTDTWFVSGAGVA